IERFEMLDEAETVAQLLSERYIQPSWIPTRYPGRSSRMHEVAVYLDRRNMSRREVTILRCDVEDGGEQFECHVNRNGEGMLPPKSFQVAPAALPHGRRVSVDEGAARRTARARQDAAAQRGRALRRTVVDLACAGLEARGDLTCGRTQARKGIRGAAARRVGR